jgi:5-methylcytosine-specific restriction enzyme subunit McrC
MNRQLIELLEYKPRTLPRNDVSEGVAIIIWENYKDQLKLESPDYRTNYQWELTSLGYVGFIPVSDELGLALRPKVGLANLGLSA